MLCGYLGIALCSFLFLGSFVIHVARTNGDLRGTRLKGIVATSRKPSAEVKPASASLELDEEFLMELAERKQREREREKKKERREERKQ